MAINLNLKWQKLCFPLLILIVSNIPAKIGDESITEDFIRQPIAHLNSGGELWVVVVNKLNRLLPKLGGLFIRNRKGHTVYKFTTSGKIFQ